jgi:glutaredoxin-related protein
LSEIGFPSSVVIAIVGVEVFDGVLVLGFAVVLVAVSGVCVVVVFIASKLLKILLRGTKSEPVIGFSAVGVAFADIGFVVVCGVVIIVVLFVGRCVVVHFIASKLLKMLLRGTKSESDCGISAVVVAIVEIAFVVVCDVVVKVVLGVGRCVVVDFIAIKLLKILLRGTKSELEVRFPAVGVAFVDIGFVVVCGVVIIVVLFVGRCFVVHFIASKLLKMLLRGTKSESDCGISAVVVAIVEIAFVGVCDIVVKVVLGVGRCVVVDFITSKLLKKMLRGTKSEPDVGFSAVGVAFVEIGFIVLGGVVLIIVLVVGRCVVVDFIAKKPLKILLRGTKSESEVVFSAIVEAMVLVIDVEVKILSGFAF